jgi:uncharacterized protein
LAADLAAPEVATLTIDTAGCSFALPVRQPRADDVTVRFESPEAAAPAPQTIIAPGRLARLNALDLITDEARYRTVGEGGIFGEGTIRFDEIGTEVTHSLTRDLSIRGDDPNSARYVIDQEIAMGRDGWRIGIVTRTEMTSTPTHFHLTGTVSTTENDEPFISREFDELIERDRED